MTDANLLADRPYEGDTLLKKLDGQRCVAVIPPKKTRKYPRPLDATSMLSGIRSSAFSKKLKRNRRASARHEKCAARFMVVVLIRRHRDLGSRDSEDTT